MPFWVYILRCRNGAYYVGHTDDLDQRVAQHQSGEVGGYTAKHLPVELVYSQDFSSRRLSINAEQPFDGLRVSGQSPLKSTPQPLRLSSSKPRLRENRQSPREEAFAAERQLKGWSRAKKEALIRGDWPELRRLARGQMRRGGHPSTSSG